MVEANSRTPVGKKSVVRMPDESCLSPGGLSFHVGRGFPMSQARPVTAVENCTVLFFEFVTLSTLVSELPISHVT